LLQILKECALTLEPRVGHCQTARNLPCWNRHELNPKSRIPFADEAPKFVEDRDRWISAGRRRVVTRDRDDCRASRRECDFLGCTLGIVPNHGRGLENPRGRLKYTPRRLIE